MVKFVLLDADLGSVKVFFLLMAKVRIGGVEADMVTQDFPIVCITLPIGCEVNYMVVPLTVAD